MSRSKEIQTLGAGQVVPFRTEGSPPRRAEPSMPTLSWEDLQAQLSDLAVSPAQRAMVEILVSATRKQAAFKPAPLVWREVFCIASVLMDETFHPQLEEDGMT